MKSFLCLSLHCVSLHFVVDSLTHLILSLFLLELNYPRATLYNLLINFITSWCLYSSTSVCWPPPLIPIINPFTKFYGRQIEREQFYGTPIIISFSIPNLPFANLFLFYLLLVALACFRSKSDLFELFNEIVHWFTTLLFFSCRWCLLPVTLSCRS